MHVPGVLNKLAIPDRHKVLARGVQELGPNYYVRLAWLNVMVITEVCVIIRLDTVLINLNCEPIQHAPSFSFSAYNMDVFELTDCVRTVRIRETKYT